MSVRFVMALGEQGLPGRGDRLAMDSRTNSPDATKAAFGPHVNIMKRVLSADVTFPETSLYDSKAIADGKVAHER